MGVPLLLTKQSSFIEEADAKALGGLALCGGWVGIVGLSDLTGWRVCAELILQRRLVCWRWDLILSSSFRSTCSYHISLLYDFLPYSGRLYCDRGSVEI